MKRSRLESPEVGGDEILPVMGDLSHYEEYPINQPVRIFWIFWTNFPILPKPEVFWDDHAPAWSI